MPNSPRTIRSILRNRMSNATRRTAQLVREVRAAYKNLHNHIAQGQFIYLNRTKAKTYKNKKAALQRNLNQKRLNLREATKNYNNARKAWEAALEGTNVPVLHIPSLNLN